MPRLFNKPKPEPEPKPCDCEPAIGRLKQMEQYWELGIDHPSLKFRPRYMRQLCTPGTCPHSDSFRATNAQAASRRTSNKHRIKQRQATEKQAADLTNSMTIMGQYITKLERQMALMGQKSIKPPELTQLQELKTMPSDPAATFTKWIDLSIQYMEMLEQHLQQFGINTEDIRLGYKQPSWMGMA